MGYGSEAAGERESERERLDFSVSDVLMEDVYGRQLLR